MATITRSGLLRCYRLTYDEYLYALLWEARRRPDSPTTEA